MPAEFGGLATSDDLEINAQVACGTLLVIAESCTITLNPIGGAHGHATWVAEIVAVKLLIITSCTGEKTVEDNRQLVRRDFLKGSAHVKERERELNGSMRKAGEMYAGQQHVRLMRGVQIFREACKESSQINLQIVSAGYGLIPETRAVAPYECTFQGMRANDLREMADALGIPAAFRATVHGSYDLGVILLGESYLEACRLDEKVEFGGPTVLFCSGAVARKLPLMRSVKVISVSPSDTKRFSSGLVALKGELARRLLVRLTEDRNLVKLLMEPGCDILGLLEAAGKHEAQKPDKKVSCSAAVSQVIKIAPSWWEKVRRKKLRYFIPEWDDLVDPNYDFVGDEHSSGKADWSNEVYAHQLYSEPNYDGVLMSRAIAESKKNKKARLQEMGVHQFLRLPQEFPVMGDCGAFDYIEAELPPYSTEDVISYYTRLGFNYGVSVDHLIVSATEHQKKFRYELTMHNAEEFLKQHRTGGYEWVPIGAVQGWDAPSYAKAAGNYIKMGYKYIGLGGLVRSTTPDILGILEAVHDVVPAGIGVHLFGLARLRAAKRMAEFGVTSVDSASALRQAWFGAKDNYWCMDGKHYRAIRVPHARKSFRAKRIVGDGRASADFVEKAERRCMEALRAFDKGKKSVDEVIRVLEDLDHLITPDRPTFMDQYRRTLEDAPWRNCPCDICRRDGIEVIIFRGNDRNRRRGFHNTFVFYRLLQRALSGEQRPWATGEGD